MPKIVRFEWSAETATAPDGTRYAIFSEHVRGEPRYYWPKVYKPKSRQVTGLRLDDWWAAGDNVYTSSAAAKARAERHWHDSQKVTLEH